MAVLCRHALVFAFTLGTETDLRPHSPEQWVTGLLTDTISQFLESLPTDLHPSNVATPFRTLCFPVLPQSLLNGLLPPNPPPPALPTTAPEVHLSGWLPSTTTCLLV